MYCVRLICTKCTVPTVDTALATPVSKIDSGILAKRLATGDFCAGHSIEWALGTRANDRIGFAAIPQGAGNEDTRTKRITLFFVAGVKKAVATLLT